MIRQFENKDGSHLCLGMCYWNRYMLLSMLSLNLESSGSLEAWEGSNLAAVFGKGDSACEDDYRGIKLVMFSVKGSCMVLDHSDVVTVG